MSQTNGHSKVFVGNLSFFCSKEDLERLFRPFGEIESVHLCKSREGEPLYYGFVHFFDPCHAQTAISSLNNTLFGGRILRVHQGHSSRAAPVQIEGVEILVSFLSYQTAVTITEEVLYHVFSQYGHVVDCVVKNYTIFNDPTSPKASRQSGYGFLTLQNIESAQCVIHEVKSSAIPNFQNAFGEFAYSSDALLQTPLVMLDCKLSRNASSRLQALLANPRPKTTSGNDLNHRTNQSTNPSITKSQPFLMNSQMSNENHGTAFAMNYQMPHTPIYHHPNSIVPPSLQTPLQPMVHPVFIPYASHIHPLSHHQPSMLSTLPPPPQLSVLRHSSHLHSSSENIAQSNNNAVYTTSLNPPPGFITHTGSNVYTNSPIMHGMPPFVTTLPSLPPPAILPTFSNSPIISNNPDAAKTCNKNNNVGNSSRVEQPNMHLQSFQVHQYPMSSMDLSRSNSHSSNNSNFPANQNNSTYNSTNYTPSGISTNIAGLPAVVNNPFHSSYQTSARVPTSSSCSSSTSYVNSPAQNFLNNNNNSNNNINAPLNTTNAINPLANYSVVQQQPQQYFNPTMVVSAHNNNVNTQLYENH